MKRWPWLGAAAACLAAAGYLSADDAPGDIQVLGPLAPIAAQIQWVRAHAARLAGDEGRAFALMQSALQLQPRSSAAWIALSNQLGLQFASAESGRSPGERAEWLQAACQLLEEGQSLVPHSDALALHRGLLLMSHAETDAELAWPGSTAGLWADAAAAFDEAATHARGKEARTAATAARDYARAAAATLQGSSSEL